MHRLSSHVTLGCDDAEFAPLTTGTAGIGQECKPERICVAGYTRRGNVEQQGMMVVQTQD
jgi:hypothetical protein